MRFPSAGSYLRAWYGPRYCSIDVTPGRGAASAGVGSAVPLAEPAPGRFERPLLDAGLALFALDLRDPAPPDMRAWLDAPGTFRGRHVSVDAESLDAGGVAGVDARGGPMILAGVAVRRADRGERRGMAAITATG